MSAFLDARMERDAHDALVPVPLRVEKKGRCTMRSIRNTLALTLVAGALAIVGANAGGEKLSAEEAWIRSEFIGKDAACFTADRFLYCPYNAEMPGRQYTTIHEDDLPPMGERRPALVVLSEKQ